MRLTEPDRTTLLAAAAGRASATGRCELPPDEPGLVGRDHAVAALTRVADRRRDPGSRWSPAARAPGRTALAVHVAHRVRDRFPDGQVYADLDQPRRRPCQLTRCSAGCCAPSASPTRRRPATNGPRWSAPSSPPAGCWWCSTTWRAEAQVRPLLTGDARGAVLLTSRRGLVALPGAHPVRLDPLDRRRRAAAARRLVGVNRVRADPAATARSPTPVRRLPLALHIAGTWLATRPHRTVADLAARCSPRTGAGPARGRRPVGARRASPHTSTSCAPTTGGCCAQLGELPELRPTDRHLERRPRRPRRGWRMANLLTPTGTGYRIDPLVRRLRPRGHRPAPAAGGAMS